MGHTSTTKKTLYSYQKRKESILKKASELSILCGVEVGVIIYGPHHNDTAPTVFPQNLHNLNLVTEKYLHTDPNLRRETALSHPCSAKKAPCFDGYDGHIDQFSNGQLIELAIRLERKIADVNQRIDSVKTSQNPVPVEKEQYFDDLIPIAELLGEDTDAVQTQWLLSDSHNRIDFFPGTKTPAQFESGQFKMDESMPQCSYYQFWNDVQETPGFFPRSQYNLLQEEGEQFEKKEFVDLPLSLDDYPVVDQFFDDNLEVLLKEMSQTERDGSYNAVESYPWAENGARVVQAPQNFSRLAPWEKMLLQC